MESGWNVWVWLVGVASRRWVRLVGVGGIYGCQIAIFLLRTVRIHIFALYSDDIHSFDWKAAVEHDGGV